MRLRFLLVHKRLVLNPTDICRSCLVFFASSFSIFSITAFPAPLLLDLLNDTLLLQLFFCLNFLVPCLGRAAQAQNSGLFRQEIVPVATKFVDDAGKEREVTVAKDDGIRAGTTLVGLAKLRPAFKADGSTTAGESSAGRGR